MTGADLVEVYTITVAHYPSELLTTISKAAFAVLLAAAQSWGRILFVAAPEPVEVAVPIGNAVACQLHRELGRLGYRAHDQTASEVLGRAVTSLAALSTAERDLVREYAYGQMGLMVGDWAAAWSPRSPVSAPSRSPQRVVHRSTAC
ncbi:hypothetical protein EHF33_13870 [Deinococcus psychrotolerans]|uniref:Uncharacterized protein n=1 Tax=Deinococcus psychrotolerans TaxID=2489213 RepID=A0A3G8YFA0_9DEIO|nr:hypothetical protein [Deinococcus psychrotolerans]AZI44009.1 hypothetical protein EHF33_13870 [Deinococcus psychrotolerans]